MKTTIKTQREALAEINALRQLLAEKEHLISQKENELLKTQNILSEKNNQISTLKSQYQQAAEFQIKYEMLLEHLRMEKLRHYGRKSEKDPRQVDMFDEAGMSLPQEVKEQLADADKSTVEVKAHVRKNHPIRKPLPEALPREVITHDISDNEKICECGCALVKIGEEVTEQLKYIPASLVVQKHVRFKYACKPCEGNIKIAPMPVLLLPKSIATPELVAQTIIEKYTDHIPLYRQEKIWRRVGVELLRSSLCGWIIKTAELCQPLIRLLHEHLIKHNYVQADETPVQVLKEKNRSNTKKSYMWCYRGGGEHQIIIYDYQETRGGYHAQEFLSGFTGYLQSDAYSGYYFADRNPNITPLSCHAHARRKFKEITKLSKSPGLANEAVLFYQKLYAIEDEARDNKLTPQQRFELRIEKSKPILEAFKSWLDFHLTKTSEQAAIGKAIRYCLGNWKKLMVYLDDGHLEIDNNLIENAIRPFALGRKNWLFMGSPAGAEAGTVFYSLIQTCVANEIEPLRYLVAMLHRIRFCKTDDDYRQLLPFFITL